MINKLEDDGYIVRTVDASDTRATLLFRTEKGKVAVTNAQITLASPLYKITNLSVQLEFLQSDAVGDTVKATTYRLFFADQNGNKISNEHMYQADKREEEAAKRVFKLKFTFRNQSYDKTKKYYLIAIDDKTGMETFRLSPLQLRFKQMPSA